MINYTRELRELGFTIPRPTRIDAVEIVRLVRIAFTRGLGLEDDPVRLVTQWWTEEGELIKEQDSAGMSGQTK